jgi:hypothetical protein
MERLISNTSMTIDSLWAIQSCFRGASSEMPTHRRFNV